MYFDQKGRLSQQSQIHSNSQTLAVDKKTLKKKQNAHALLNNQIQNQSENILAKLQSLLVNKEDERKSSNERAQNRMDKRGKQLNNQHNNISKQRSQ